ncbi:YdbC family protein [Lactococcus cremoris]
MVLDLTNKNTQSDFNFEKTEEIAILDRSRKNWTTELNLVSYNGNKSVIDLRQWSPEGKMGKGLTLTEQTAKNLLLALESYFGNEPTQETVAEECFNY